MTSFQIHASYNKNENVSEVKPIITNTINVTNAIGENDISAETSTETPSTSSNILPAKTFLKNQFRVREKMIDDQNKSKFESQLLSITLAVLTSQDKVLMNNIIDQSGEIILALADLKKLIQTLTGEEDIEITTDEHPLAIGCFKGKKLPIWKPIRKIIVNQLDFQISWNQLYVLMNTYKISLEKVVE